MRIIKKYKAAFIYGKALKQFFNGNYKSAIYYFEQVLKIEPRYGNRGYTRYYLGRSFFAVEDTDRAKEEMSAAYNMLRQRIIAEKNEKDINYFRSLAHEYIQLLSSLNEISLAQEIKDDKEKIVGNLVEKENLSGKPKF